VFLRTSFQILFGLTLGLSGATACLYLGLLVRGSPDGWTAATLASLLIAAQACAAFVFRKRIVLPAILGLALCGAATMALLWLGIPFFWETQISTPRVQSRSARD
jgi:hypothetical protein